MAKGLRSRRVPVRARAPPLESVSWQRQALEGLDLDRVRSNGYIFLVEMAYIAHRLGYRIAEVPIHFPDRQRGDSKMDVKIQIEAAFRLWQIVYRHHMLKPEMRRTEAYPAEAGSR